MLLQSLNKQMGCEKFKYILYTLKLMKRFQCSVNQMILLAKEGLPLLRRIQS